MEKIIANGKLEITLPDGFHLMSEEEKSELPMIEITGFPLRRQ